MQWMLRNRTDLLETKKWFLFVDDDTWINVPALLDYFGAYSETLPVAFGYVWDDVWARGAVYSGGAGIIMSRSAFRISKDMERPASAAGSVRPTSGGALETSTATTRPDPRARATETGR